MSKQKRKNRPVQNRKIMQGLNAEHTHILMQTAGMLGISLTEALRYSVNLAFAYTYKQQEKARERSEEVRQTQTSDGFVTEPSTSGSSESNVDGKGEVRPE